MIEEIREITDLVSNEDMLSDIRSHKGVIIVTLIDSIKANYPFKLAEIQSLVLEYPSYTFYTVDISERENEAWKHYGLKNFIYVNGMYSYCVEFRDLKTTLEAVKKTYKKKK